MNPEPCDVTLGFNDAGGRALKQTHVTLLPGQSASLDIAAREAGSARRVELQPFLAPAGRGFVLTTAEIFDQFTGRTMVVLNSTEPRSLGAPGSTAGQ